MNDDRKELGRVLAERTLALVEIPSVSGNEARAAGFVEDFLARAAPDFLRRRGNAVVAGYGSEAPGVVLAGHLDTVPGNGNPRPEIAGDEVVGLGTADMKGALAVMLTLAERRPRRGRPVGFVFYDNEEVSYEANGLGPLLETEPWLTRAELALLLEPTAGTLELGCNGSIHAWVAFRGTAAHSARPWMGENAIHRAAPFLERLARTAPREFADGPAVFREVLSATLAEGGTARNVIPDRFRVNVNLRFPPDRTPEQAVAYLESLVPEGGEVTVTDVAPPAPARADAPLLARLRDRFGLAARAKQGWTDVARFARHGIPAANLGPGDPELAHRRDERVGIESLVRVYETLHAFLSGEETPA